MKRTPIRQRSKKMEAIYRKRRPFVAKFLEEHPYCLRCMRKYTAYPGGYPTPRVNPATEVHEKQTRARGGDILDPENCVALCETCHQEIHAHPRQATEEGFLKSNKQQFSFRS